MTIHKPTIFWIGISILFVSLILSISGGTFPLRSKKDKTRKNYIVMYIGLCIICIGIVMTCIGLIPSRLHHLQRPPLRDAHPPLRVHVPRSAPHRQEVRGRPPPPLEAPRGPHPKILYSEYEYNISSPEDF
jgi:hypothetical protein